jgi:hypothetical protein
MRIVAGACGLCILSLVACRPKPQRAEPIHDAWIATAGSSRPAPTDAEPHASGGMGQTAAVLDAGTNMGTDPYAATDASYATDAGDPANAPFYRRLLGALGPTYRLLSAIGPIVSVYQHTDWYEEGIGGFSHHELSVYTEGEYRFDLQAYLRDSGQIPILEKAVADAASGYPMEPHEAEASAVADASLLESSLRQIEGWAFVRSSLQSFWIDWWNGGDIVALVIELAQPVSQRSVGAPLYVRICVQPPPEWLPWLREVDNENAVLASGLAQMRTRLTRAETRAARAVLKRLSKPARRRWIKRNVYEAQHAARTADELLAEFYPLPTIDGGPSGLRSAEAQLALSDRIAYLSHVDEFEACEKLADVAFTGGLAKEAIGPTLASVASCLDGSLQSVGYDKERFVACRNADDPLACARPVYTAARSYRRSVSVSSTPTAPADPCPAVALITDVVR